MAAATVSSSNPQVTMASQPAQVSPSSPTPSTTSSSSRFGVRSHLASAARLLSSRLSLATSSTTTHTDSTQARARMMPPAAAAVVASPAPPQAARAVSSPAHLLATAGAPTADPEDADADPSPSTAPNGSSSSASAASRPATLSGATDVVVVEHASGKRKATPFHARFGRLKVPRPDGRPIAVVVNGQTLPFMMRLGHDGMAVWWRDARDNLVRRDALIAAPSSSVSASATDAPAVDDSSEGTPPPPPPPVADRGNDNTPQQQQPQVPTSRWAKISAVLAASVRSATSSSSNRVDDADSLPPDVLAILSLTTPKAASPTFGSGSGSSRRRGRKHRRKRGDQVTASTDSVDVAAPPESMAMTPIRSATAIWVADPEDVVTTPAEEKDSKDDEFWRPGADVPKSFLPKAIRSGSFSSTNDDYSSDASESGGMRASEDAGLTDTEPSMPCRPTAATGAAADPMLASFTSTTSTTSSASSTCISGSSVLRPDELAVLPLHWGANDIEYITLRDRPRARSRSAGARDGATDRPATPTTTPNPARIRVIRKRARVWLWPSSTKVVVSDVDGTITRSDALGIILPAMFGYQYAHPGIAKLYSRVAQHGYQFLYVTSRGIAQADATRAYVQSIKQQDADGDEHVGLPDGPVLTSPDGLMAALRREVVLKTPQEFKITTLAQVAALFDEAGDEVPRGSTDRDLASAGAATASPFVAGFGNRETDMIAYTAVAIPPTHCFCVDNSGSIVVLHQQQESALRQAQQVDGAADGAEHPDEFAEILANPIQRSAATRAIFSTDPNVGPTGPHGGSAPRSMTPTPVPVAPRAVPPVPARAMTAFTVSSIPPGGSRDLPAADTTQLEIVSYVTLSNRVSVLFPRCQDEE
ncbi:Nuclear elongation and deformation protein 1 [Allomyces javanicus]|nr:Nuclear elongation and deformation protein 1 [Allomyces javanicus]